MSIPTVFYPNDYFAKATALRDKGKYLVAARLYAECAERLRESAADEDTLRKAQMEQVTCYVKGADIPSAQRLAARLLAGRKDLSAVERIKLEAVLKEGR